MVALRRASRVYTGLWASAAGAAIQELFGLSPGDPSRRLAQLGGHLPDVVELSVHDFEELQGGDLGVEVGEPVPIAGEREKPVGHRRVAHEPAFRGAAGDLAVFERSLAEALGEQMAGHVEQGLETSPQE